MARGEFLLEVQTEEIPARMLAPATEELATRVFEDLMSRGLGPREVETAYTPRRLVLVLKGLPEAEPDRQERVMGPPVKAAYGADGAPTQALLGFARRCGVEPEELERVETEKGEYLAARREIAGRPAAEVLAEIVPRVLAGLAWAKTMRWGRGQGPWVRPVHGLLARLDGQVVAMDLFGVASGDATCGHPVLSSEPFPVRDAADYRRKLARRGIEVRPQERRRLLHEGMVARAQALGGQLVEDPELLDRLVAICEIPGVLEGGFDEGFLELPREVLSASLRDHQSAFTVENRGRLLPVFLTVMDRADDPEGRVRSGNEWVVAARLADARFFYQEDRKVPLAERVPRLDQLTFHERLGSYADKAGRLVELGEFLCRDLGWAEELAAVAEAARLLKVDLTTEMVKEFTSLQGVMGGLYAREEGYPEAVWQALYDQYRPAATADPIPRGRPGRVLALADRVDTVVGIFGLGLVPTGSKDPFGLRRAAQGAVRILLEGGLGIDLDLMLAKAARLYGGRLDLGVEELLEGLRPFLHDRIRHLLGLEGYAYDEVEAALGVGVRDLPDLAARVDALNRVRGEPAFLSVVLAAKRIANIVKGSPEHALDPELLVEEAEGALHAAFQELKSEVEEAVEAGKYERALRQVADLAPVLDRFFIDVLVMDENLQLRHNRIALLQAIHRVISRTAALTEVVVDKAEYRAKG